MMHLTIAIRDQLFHSTSQPYHAQLITAWWQYFTQHTFHCWHTYMSPSNPTACERIVKSTLCDDKQWTNSKGNQTITSLTLVHTSGLRAQHSARFLTNDWDGRSSGNGGEWWASSVATSSSTSIASLFKCSLIHAATEEARAFWVWLTRKSSAEQWAAVSNRQEHCCAVSSDGRFSSRWAWLSHCTNEQNQ